MYCSNYTANDEKKLYKIKDHVIKIKSFFETLLIKTTEEQLKHIFVPIKTISQIIYVSNKTQYFRSDNPNKLYF